MHRSVDQTTRILRHQPLEGLSLQTSRGIFAGLCSKRTKLRTGVSAMSRQLLIGLISTVMACGLTPTEGHAAPIHDSHGHDVAHLEAKSGLMLSFKDILIENYARYDNFFLGRNCKNIVCAFSEKTKLAFSLTGQFSVGGNTSAGSIPSDMGWITSLWSIGNFESTTSIVAEYLNSKAGLLPKFLTLSHAVGVFGNVSV